MEWSALRRAPALSVPDLLSVDLERLILTGELGPGDRLPAERELAGHLGVSRVSVRQALHELEARGLIDRRPGRGTIVVSPADRAGAAGSALAQLLAAASATTTTELARVMELRAVIEPPIAGLAAQRVTARDVETLRELVDLMDRESDVEAYAELDRSFHHAIAVYTHNPLLSQVTELIADQIAPSRRTSLLSSERMTASNIAHRRIVEAIRDRDCARAEHEAREHVAGVLRIVADSAVAPEENP